MPISPVHELNNTNPRTEVHSMSEACTCTRILPEKKYKNKRKHLYEVKIDFTRIIFFEKR